MPNLTQDRMPRQWVAQPGYSGGHAPPCIAAQCVGHEVHKRRIYFYGTEGTLHIGWRNDGTTFYPRNKNAETINVPPELHLPDSQSIPERR